MIAVVNFRPGWSIGQKTMEINALALSVLMNECVGIQPESLATRIVIGNSPEAKGQDSFQIGTVDGNAKHQAALSRTKKDGHIGASGITIGSPVNAAFAIRVTAGNGISGSFEIHFAPLVLGALSSKESRSLKDGPVAQWRERRFPKPFPCFGLKRETDDDSAPRLLSVYPASCAGAISRLRGVSQNGDLQRGH